MFVIVVKLKCNYPRGYTIHCAVSPLGDVFRTVLYVCDSCIISVCIIDYS